MSELDAILDAAKTAFASGRTAEAARYLEAALRLAPGNLGVLADLLYLHIGTKDWNQVARYARDMLSVMPSGNLERRLAACSILLQALKLSGRDSDIQHEYARMSPVVEAAIKTTGNRKDMERFHGDVVRTTIYARDADLGAQWLRRQYPQAEGIKLPFIISSTRSVRDWCTQEGIQVKEVDASRTISVRNGLFSRTYVTKPFFLAIIPKGEVLLGWDHVMAPSGDVLSDSGHADISTAFARWFPHAIAEEIASAIHPWRDEVTYIDEDVVLLPGPERLQVGHWIIDFLPRLRAQKYVDFLKIKFVIPRQLPKKHRDLLSLFGVSGAQLEECDLGSRYRFRNVLVVQPGDALNPSPETTKFLANAMRSAPVPKTRRRRIFLLRSTPTRKIKNSDELAQLLAAHAFEYIDLAEASIDEQRSRLGEADIVISIFGSDLLSLLFMHAGSDLIELKYNNDLVCCTDPMFSTLKVNYHVFPCEPDARTDKMLMKKDRDFSVNCPALEHLLQAILARKASGLDYQAPMDEHIETVAPATPPRQA